MPRATARTAGAAVVTCAINLSSRINLLERSRSRPIPANPVAPHSLPAAMDPRLAAADTAVVPCSRRVPRTIGPDMNIRIVIADDHTLMREGLKRILDGVTDIIVIGEAVDGYETLARVRQADFDLLLLDMSMPGKSGVELIRQVKEVAPRLPILVLTMYEEQQYAVRAIRAGARGYLTKESAGTQLICAIRKVAAGRPYISMAVAEQLAIDAMPANENLPHKALSNREFEVFSMLVIGKSITEIATTLHLSVKTVSTHKTRILQKMSLNSLAELVQYAIAYHLLSPMQM